MAEYIDKDHFDTRVRLAIGMAGEEEFTEDFKDGVLFVLNLLKSEENEDAIPILEGATNGDMIKAMFNPVQIIKYTSCVQVYFSDDYYKFFDMYWWNAPYKKGNANG